MDVNSPQSAAGGFSVKSRLEELEEVIFLPTGVWSSIKVLPAAADSYCLNEGYKCPRKGVLVLLHADWLVRKIILPCYTLHATPCI